MSLDGKQLQVVVDWPLLLHGLTPIQLSATCEVVRCQEGMFAVRLVHYEFRTRRTQAVDIRQLAAGA